MYYCGGPSPPPDKIGSPSAPRTPKGGTNLPSAPLRAKDKIERVKAKTFEELGKASLTVSVAWIVFGIIQPIFSERFSIQLAVIAFLGFLLFLAIGVILLERSSNDKG